MTSQLPYYYIGKDGKRVLARDLEDDRDRLREAMQELHDDMLERAECKMDVIRGEQYRVVNAGNGAWTRFCEALKQSKGSD